MKTIQTKKSPKPKESTTSKALARLTGSVPPCPGGCDHSMGEHIAFDKGVIAGEKGQNPYSWHHLSEAWLTGHSVGQQNRRAEAEAQNGELTRGDES